MVNSPITCTTPTENIPETPELGTPYYNEQTFASQSVIVVFHCISSQRLISVGDMDIKRNSPMALTTLLRLVLEISILIKIYPCTFEYTMVRRYYYMLNTFIGSLQ